MRTKEQGLLTSADAWELAGLQIRLQESAHGGDILCAADCRACKRLVRVMNLWLAAHVASEEEMAELEAARLGDE